MRKRVIGRLQAVFAAVLLTTSLWSGFVTVPAHASGATGISGPSSLSGVTGTPVNVGGLEITGTASDTTSLQLRVTHGELELTDTTGVTVTSSNPDSVFSMTGTIANINAALDNIEYTRTSGIGSDTLEATTVGEGQVYFPATGHIYEYVANTNGEGDPTDIDWTDANAKAPDHTFQGMTGYLTTITSAEENDYVAARLEDAGWMGASDADIEEDWKWVTGPETGTPFWSGNETTGVPVAGRYNNWGEGEPNNAGDEDCAQFLSGGSGKWNDLPCVGANLPGYVVEYGDDENTPTVASKNVTITVSADTKEASTCEELFNIGENFANELDTIVLENDIDCGGQTVDPLFTYNGFKGVFDGQGHTIKNFNIDGVEDSYSEGGNAGLFVWTQDATIRDVHLTGGTIKGYNGCGAAVGWAYDTTIENVTSDMTIDCQSYGAGGLVGGLEVDDPEVEFSRSFSSGTVLGGQNAGGVIGALEIGSNGTFLMEQTFATGDIHVNYDVAGGLIGSVYSEGWDDPEASVTIRDVYAQGEVAAEDTRAGGLIGEVYTYEDGSPTSFTLSHAYASGDVEAQAEAGGLIGFVRGSNATDVEISITSTFAVGAVTSEDAEAVGAVVGYYDHRIYDVDWDENYFDRTRTGHATCYGGETGLGDCEARNMDGAEPKYFFTKTNAPMTDWDFSDIWIAHANTWPTFEDIDDDDEDGIAASIEQAAPNNGDANGDGTPDNQQPNVSSFIDPVTNKYVSLAVSDGCSNTEASVASEDSKAAKDSGYDYPAGLMSFTSVCGSNGFTATITQFYYGVSSSGLVARKYNPTSHAYFMVPGAVVSSVTIGGQSATKVVYQVKDGGDLDVDAVANGTIVDPAGPATSATGTPNTGVRTWQDILLKQD